MRHLDDIRDGVGTTCGKMLEKFSAREIFLAVAELPRVTVRAS